MQISHKPMFRKLLKLFGYVCIQYGLENDTHNVARAKSVQPKPAQARNPVGAGLSLAILLCCLSASGGGADWGIMGTCCSISES